MTTPSTTFSAKRLTTAPMKRPSRCWLTRTCTLLRVLRPSGDWRALTQSMGINGSRSCQNATTTGAPAACGAIWAWPSSDHRVVRSANAK